MVAPSPTASLLHTLSEPPPLCLGPWPHLHTQTPNWKDRPKNKQAHTTAPTQACMGRARSWGSPSQGPKSLTGGTASTLCTPPLRPSPAMPSPCLVFFRVANVPSTLESKDSWDSAQLFISSEEAAHHTVSKRCQVTAAGQIGPTPRGSFQTTVSGHKAQFWHSDTW